LIGGSWSERYDRSGVLPAADSQMEWTLRLVGTEIDGQMKLPRLTCAGGGCGETGGGWPSHCRSTPELGQLQAGLSALMPYRVAADVLLHLLPIDAGRSPETLRSHTLQVGKRLGDAAAVKPPPRPSRSVWIQPSSAAAKTANPTWRSASATSRRLMVAARFLAPSPGPRPRSPR
jgi:hypothetical protein